MWVIEFYLYKASLLYPSNIEYSVGLCIMNIPCYIHILQIHILNPDTIKNKPYQGQYTHKNPRYLKSNLNRSIEIHKQKLLHRKYEFYVKNRGSTFVKFRNISTYAAYRQQYWPYFLQYTFFSKLFYTSFGYFTTWIILEIWHFNSMLFVKNEISFYSWQMFVH
jgi:hypothetical protein